MCDLVFAYLTIGAVVAGIIVMHPSWINGFRFASANMARAAIVFASIVTIVVIIIAWPAFVHEIAR